MEINNNIDMQQLKMICKFCNEKVDNYYLHVSQEHDNELHHLVSDMYGDE